MNKAEELKSYVPEDLLDSAIFQDIFNVIGAEFDRLNLKIDDLYSQCFIDTATWGLDLWETFYGICIDKSKPLNERRSKLSAKTLSNGTLTQKSIEDIAKRFVSNVKFNAHYDTYTFEIELISWTGFPHELTDLYNSIEEVKPAHLVAKYKLISMTSLDVYYGAASMMSEQITVYPYSTQKISTKGSIDIALGYNALIENTTVYPKKGVN